MVFLHLENCDMVGTCIFKGFEVQKLSLVNRDTPFYFQRDAVIVSTTFVVFFAIEMTKK